MDELLTIKEASEWASVHLKKNVTVSNISYLVQYGRIPKIGNNGSPFVNKKDLIEYYRTHNLTKEASWKNQLGGDLNWKLSFSEYKEAETTKHVHRLHPYKGKFIPQLVEYFLDTHTDKFKKEVFFKEGDIILDPFCGSGTTLVQANELGMFAVGIDISAFNSLISNAKVTKYEIDDILAVTNSITKKLKEFLNSKNNINFENRLLEELKIFNNKYFPSPAYKYKISAKEIDEKRYAPEKEKQFLSIYEKLLKEFDITLLQQNPNSFLDKWYLKIIRDEIDFIFSQVKLIKNPKTKKIVSIILSRTIRSCRATTHADLGTLFEPISRTYYCRKHGKICKPLFTTLNWWIRYCKDTITRLKEFDKLRSETSQICLVGDSRDIDIISEVKKRSSSFSKLISEKKIDGIFSSPPYVGLIDYHEQHAYAYDLFGFERKDDSEIGRLFHGQGREARESYVLGISKVLLNCKKYLKKNYNVFLVANDKYNLYSSVAEKAGMQIANTYRRPVLNRVEKDRSAYSEIIFHLKEK